jgi:hypothetical protein
MTPIDVYLCIFVPAVVGGVGWLLVKTWRNYPQ